MDSLNPELQQLIAQEAAKYEATEVISKVTNVCWSKCITGTPGSKFSSSESTCLQNCAQRYLDMSLLIMKHLGSS